MVGKRRLLRGHYNPTNWTRKFPNLQKSKLPNGDKALVCAQCLRTMVKPPRKVKIKTVAFVASPTSVL